MAGTLFQEGPWLGATGDPNLVSETSGAQFLPGQLGKIYSIPFTSRVGVALTTGAAHDFDLGKGCPRVIQCVKRVTNATEDATPRVGDLAYWQDIDDFVVCANTENAIGQTDGPKLVAGVWLGDAALTTDVPLAAGSYGYIQVGGVAPVVVVGTVAATTIGYPVIAAVTEGKAVIKYAYAYTTTTEGTVAVNDTNHAYMPVGYALTSWTTANTDGATAWIKVLLDLPVRGR